MAGITPRTLHYYDEIGLLKPAHVAENGYRYYDDGDLFRLQQILLYRELDMPLQDIKQILEKGDFDVLNALKRHKDELLKRKVILEKIINTVDQTILHMKGIKPMSKNQLFEGFSDDQQTEYAQEAMEIYDPEIVRAANIKWKNYTSSEKQRIGEEGNQVYRGFLDAMDKGPESPEAQACVESWRRHMDYFWTPNVEQLLGLAERYNNDPRFKANFDKIHPNLAEFVREAVKVYVKTKQT